MVAVPLGESWFGGSLTVTIPSASTRTTGPLTLGFLSVSQEPTGWAGHLLVTNGWGRPIEFRLTSAVQPNRVQAALYGPTLLEYLHAEVIGKTLVEKTGAKPDLIVTDSLPALTLRTRIEIPVIALAPQANPPADAVSFAHPRASAGLLLSNRFASDRSAILSLLERIDPAVDLAEPFARIREAVAEHRKMGGSNRAA
jgi:hypothetical protein